MTTTSAQRAFKDVNKFPEKTVEQTDDGAFRRQANRFQGRFGSGEGQFPVTAGRYRLLVATGCGWSRRLLIVRRLLGLQDEISIGYLTHRDADGWLFADQPGGVDAVFGVPRLNDLYRTSDPSYTGRGTVPTLADTTTGRVVSNDYHVLPLELETAWRPWHAVGAPDLYPEDLRGQIDLLNQQLFDDVNNGPYKVLFAGTAQAAEAAWAVFVARLHDLDFRLASRRYLFGDRITDSDIRLFVTLASFDQTYRPAFPEDLLQDTPRIQDLPHLWAYARDLFGTPGFIDEREQVSVGIRPDAEGAYVGGFATPMQAAETIDRLALWSEPAHREHLVGSAPTSGPGGAGTDALWQFRW